MFTRNPHTGLRWEARAHKLESFPAVLRKKCWSDSQRAGIRGWQKARKRRGRGSEVKGGVGEVKLETCEDRVKDEGAESKEKRERGERERDRERGVRESEKGEGKIRERRRKRRESVVEERVN